jgi:hypothetical protein
LTGSSQAVTSQELEQLPLHCAAITLPDDNVMDRRHDRTIPAQIHVQSSSKPQSKQQKTKRIRPKKTPKLKTPEVKSGDSEITDVSKAFAESCYSIQPDIDTLPAKKKKEKDSDLIKLAEADVDELAAVEEVSNQCRIKYNISLSEK